MPERRASSVLIQVKSRVSPCGGTAGWRSETLVVPELLDVLGAADAQHLQAFEVGAVGQQDVGEMVGLVAGVAEGDHKGELRHRLGYLWVSQNEITGLVR